MVNDLVNRLRTYAARYRICREAADRIEALEAEVAGLHRERDGGVEYIISLQSRLTAMTANAAALDEGIACLQAICATPIGRRKMNISPDDPRLAEAEKVRAAHAKLMEGK